jgi:hypothetical protein
MITDGTIVSRDSTWPNYMWPTYTWPTYTYVQETDKERYAFALELILDGDLDHDAIKDVARRALRRND